MTTLVPAVLLECLEVLRTSEGSSPGAWKLGEMVGDVLPEQGCT
eukprot:CAMPEP_0178458588 /NCGR_PEP_ID=MMETSP0689_2-20121128/47623_1 /TAXON_ID=160604 /ORGANISM="Amphidinium massartii, Strain CS-259" /LENGTH=43 /DNA_ID= /DNA_START= /DNA_END= /DNA_ORIENTATION=